MSEYSSHLEFAKNLALEAAEIAHQYYSYSGESSIKDDQTPVTEADIAINGLMIKRVKQEFPETGVLGEEESWNHENNDNLWVCDPIDGTVAYIHHIPTSMIAIAYAKDGQVKVGVAYNPWTKDMYWAEKEQGAYKNDFPIHVSAKTWGPEVTLVGSAAQLAYKEGVDKPGVIDDLKAQRIYVIGIVGSIFKNCLIAEGSVEGRISYSRHPHDHAATALIVSEAGGKVTDLNGVDQRYDSELNGCVLSNGLVHNKLLELAPKL